MLRIGFMGVGFMGHGAARNILEKGYPLTVLGHRNRQPVEDLLARGASEASDPADLARRSDVLFMCLPSAGHVELAITGTPGILQAARPGLTVVDCTTSEPEVTMRLAAALQAQGAHMVDAPFVRTPKEAEEGSSALLSAVTRRWCRRCARSCRPTPAPSSRPAPWAAGTP